MKKRVLIVSLIVGLVSMFGTVFVNSETVSASAQSEFTEKCIGLGGTNQTGSLDGRDKPYYFCSINGSGTSNSVGGQTYESALEQINQYIDNKEKYNCDRTTGKQWNSTTNACEDRSNNTGLAPSTTCPDNAFFDDICTPGTSAAGVIPKLILKILNWALVGVGTVVIIFIVIGGIMYMTAAGSAERAKQGTKIIMNALLGLVLYLVMISVLNFIIPGGVFSGT